MTERDRPPRVKAIFQSALERAPHERSAFVREACGEEPTRILVAETAVVYAPPGLLLWVQEGVLVAQRFDPARKLVSGEPIPVAQGVGISTSAWCAARLQCRPLAFSPIGPARENDGN
jgi:hypothetical protein